MRFLFLILLLPFLAQAQTVKINGSGSTVTVNAPGRPSSITIPNIVDDPPPEDLYIPMIVMTAESNSGGKALNTLATSEELAPRTQTKILNNTTLLFEDLDVGTNNLIGHENITPNTSHSWEIGIANMAAAGTIRNPTYIVKTGQGGSRIAQWAVGGTYLTVEPWTVFQNRVDAALAILNPTGIKFALLYSQGINDGIAGTNITTWINATIAHIEKIRVKYGEVPIVMTKLMTTAPNYADYNTAIETICSTVSRCYFIDVTGATTMDVYHWNYAGQKLIAQRLIDKLIENGFDL